MRLVAGLSDPLVIGELRENIVLLTEMKKKKENLLVLDDWMVLVQAQCTVQCTFNLVFNLVCQRGANH